MSNAKVVIKKVFLGKSLLTGLYLGVISGVFFAIISFILMAVVTLPSSVVDFFINNIGANYKIVLTSAVFLLFVAFGFLGFLALSLAYNLVSWMHGYLEVFMEEVEDNSIPEPGFR